MNAKERFKELGFKIEPERYVKLCDKDLIEVCFGVLYKDPLMGIYFREVRKNEGSLKIGKSMVVVYPVSKRTEKYLFENAREFLERNNIDFDKFCEASRELLEEFENWQRTGIRRW